MEINKLEEITTASLTGFAEAINKKTAELNSVDVRDLVKENRRTPDFFDLTIESQEAARFVLSEMLLTKYKSGQDLPDSTVKYLAHQVRDAFKNLEQDRPEMGCGSDIGSVDIHTS